jgi:hypothetical protein
MAVDSILEPILANYSQVLEPIDDYSASRAMTHRETDALKVSHAANCVGYPTTLDGMPMLQGKRTMITRTIRVREENREARRSMPDITASLSRHWTRRSR